MFLTMHSLAPFTLIYNVGDDWHEIGKEVEKKGNISPSVNPTSCLWRHSWDSSLGLQLLHMGLQLPTGWQVLDHGRSLSSLVAGIGSIMSN